MSEKTLKRRMIREKVLQVLYAYELNPEGLDTTIQYVSGEFESEESKEFALELIRRVVRYKDDFDKLITENLTNWALDRVAIIDKILIRIGLCELLYFSDIPVKVSLNEAVEIAKQYGTKDSAKFINGVLDSIAKDLAEQGKIYKAGPGLLDN